MNPAFYVGQQIGNNLGSAFRRTNDESAIEKILADSMQSGDPEVIQNNIGKILSQVSPERQKDAIQYLQNVSQNAQKKQMASQKAAAEREAGVTPGIHHTLQGQQLKNQQREQELNEVYGQPNQNASQPQDPFAQASNEDLTKLVGHPNRQVAEHAKAVLNQRNEIARNDQKKQIAKNERYGKRNDKIIEGIDEAALSLPKQEATLNLMEKAILDRDLSFWTKDNLADMTGIEWFRTPEGALFKAQAKQYFLGDLERIKGRANQLLERQILDAQAKIGNDTGANLTVVRADRMRLQLKKAEIVVANGILDEYREQGKEPHNFAQEINKRMQPIADQIEKETMNDMSAIDAINNNRHREYTKVQKGTVASDFMIQALLKKHKNDPKKVASELERLGYVE